MTRAVTMVPVTSVEEVYPGYGTGWVPGGAIPVPTQYCPRTHISHISGYKPYPRPNEGELRLFHEVSQMGPRMGLEWVPEWPQNDLQIDLPDWSRDGPQIDLR